MDITLRSCILDWLSKTKTSPKSCKETSPAFLKGLCASKYNNTGLISCCCVKYNRQVYHILQDWRTVLTATHSTVSYIQRLVESAVRVFHFFTRTIFHPSRKKLEKHISKIEWAEKKKKSKKQSFFITAEGLLPLWLVSSRCLAILLLKGSYYLALNIAVVTTHLL